MKASDLTPCFENVFESFSHDSIGRDRDVFDFCKILDCIDGPYCIAVDGSWGSGKTFFIKQVQMVLNSVNPNIYDEHLSEDKKERISQVCGVLSKGQDVSLQPQVCVYYDAWENDNDDDPILSLVYQICGQIQNDYNFTTDTNFTDKAVNLLLIAAKIAENLAPLRKLNKLLSELFGENQSVTDVCSDAIKSLSQKKQNLLAEVTQAKNVEQRVKEFLKTLLPEKGNRLVIFIDELDRCNPAYAVKLLERVKHYFGDENITFVFSINAKELEHTISSYYGTNFDSGRYLDRFFDLRIALPEPNMKYFYQDIGLSDSSWWYDIIRRAFIQTYGLSLREISRYIYATKLAAPKPLPSTYYPSSTDRAKVTVLPIMIGLKILGSSLYDAFISGKNPQPLIDVAKNVSPRTFRFLLNENEVFETEESSGGNQKIVCLEDRLAEYYNALFGVDVTEARCGYVVVGNIEIESNTATILKRIAGGLEINYAD